MPAEQRGRCRVLEGLQRIWTLVLLKEMVRTKKGGDELHGQIYGQGQGWHLQFWMIWSEERHDVGIWEAREVNVTEAELLERTGRKYTAPKTHSFSGCQYTSIAPGDRQHCPSLGCPVVHKSLGRTDFLAATVRQEPLPGAWVPAAGSDQTLGANITVPIVHQHPTLLFSGLQMSSQPLVEVTNQSVCYGVAGGDNPPNNSPKPY